MFFVFVYNVFVINWNVLNNIAYNVNNIVYVISNIVSNINNIVYIKSNIVSNVNNIVYKM